MIDLCYFLNGQWNIAMFGTNDTRQAQAILVGSISNGNL